MSYFTKEQEEKAVALILRECNFFETDDKNSRSMAYVERDREGYIVGLVDLGLRQVPSVFPRKEEENTGNRSTRQKAIVVKPRHWIMPPFIGYLTRLRKLTVYYCKGLPREIVHLSGSLQEIAFHFCDELDFDALPKEFECLDKLIDIRIHGRTTKTQRILPIHRFQNFSNLRYLYYRGGSSIDSNADGKGKIDDMFVHPAQEIFNPSFRLIQDLLNDGIKFKKSLEILEIEGGDINEFTVADIFSQVLPRYPNLKRLILPKNQIRSLGPLIAQQSLTVPATVRLKCFYLVGNPILDLTCPEEVVRCEKMNLQRLLTHYEELTSLGHGITESGLCTTEMLLALDLNDGGKILLSKRFKPIPLSVWPVVLERVNQRKGYYDSNNVLYYLLRNGPALGKRKEGNSSRSTSTSTTDPSPITAALDTDKMIATMGVPPTAQYSPNYDVVITPTTVIMDKTPRKRKISMP